MLWNPTLFVKRRDWSKLADAIARGVVVGYLPPENRRLVSAHTGGTPSTGLMFCYFLKQLRGKLDRQSFFGFSFIDQLEDRRAHYFDSRPPSDVHQWRAERAFFDSLF